MLIKPLDGTGHCCNICVEVQYSALFLKLLGSVFKQTCLCFWNWKWVWKIHLLDINRRATWAGESHRLNFCHQEFIIKPNAKLCTPDLYPLYVVMTGDTFFWLNIQLFNNSWFYVYFHDFFQEHFWHLLCDFISFIFSTYYTVTCFHEITPCIILYFF